MTKWQMLELTRNRQYVTLYKYRGHVSLYISAAVQRKLKWPKDGKGVFIYTNGERAYVTYNGNHKTVDDNARKFHHGCVHIPSYSPIAKMLGGRQRLEIPVHAEDGNAFFSLKGGDDGMGT